MPVEYTLAWAGYSNQKFEKRLPMSTPRPSPGVLVENTVHRLRRVFLTVRDRPGGLSPIRCSELLSANPEHVCYVLRLLYVVGAVTQTRRGHYRVPGAYVPNGDAA